IPQPFTNYKREHYTSYTSEDKLYHSNLKCHLTSFQLHLLIHLDCVALMFKHVQPIYATLFNTPSNHAFTNLSCDPLGDCSIFKTGTGLSYNLAKRSTARQNNSSP